MANFNQFKNGTARIPRVLFFTAGMVPTDEEFESASRFHPNVGIRNGAQVADMPMSALEECDAVAGTVPPRYAKTYPNVSDFDGQATMLRMSDLDRYRGKVTDTDNEAKRGAKPPTVGADRVLAQGASRPVGAIISESGGYLAPRPSDPNNLSMFGSERAENAPAGTEAAAMPANANPHSLPDAGITQLPPGQDESALTAAGAVTEPMAGGGFKAPEPAVAKPETAKERKAREAAEKEAAEANS